MSSNAIETTEVLPEEVFPSYKPAPAESELPETDNLRWKEGVKPESADSAIRLIGSIHKRQKRIHDYRRRVSKFFLLQFRDYGRDLEQLKHCYETTQAFLDFATVEFDKKESSIHAMIDVANNWELLVNGFENLNAKQVIGTISEARRFLSKLKGHPIEPETPREERERAQAAFAATKSAGAEKWTPSTRKYMERAAPALKELALNKNLTEDERTEIEKAVGIIARVVGAIHKREKAAMAEPGTEPEEGPTTDEWVADIESESSIAVEPITVTTDEESAGATPNPSFAQMFPYKGKTLEEATENLAGMERICEELWNLNGAAWSRSLGLRESAYRRHKKNLSDAIERMQQAQPPILERL
nr:hypothetical protein 15 [bacterium]